MRESQVININIRNFILISIFGFVILFYFLGFGGLILSDDITYGNCAYHMANGTYDVQNDIFANRIAVFVPTSLLYFLLGVNDVTTTLWPLLCFVGIGLLLLFNYKKSNPTIAFYAVVISSLNFYPLFFSNKLFPDVIVSFFSLLSTVVLFQRDKPDRKYLMPVLFSISIMTGFLAKETIVYTIPFYGLVFLNDLVKGKNYYFWILAGIVFFILSGIYLGVYKYYTGDFLYRFNVIHDAHYPSVASYYDKPFSYMIGRITYQPLIMFISSEIFIPLAFAIPLIVHLRIKDIFDLENEEKYWALFCLSVILMFWFGSTGYKFYNPISLNPRMFIMLVPPLAILAAISIYNAQTNSTYYLWYSLLFLFAVIVSFFAVSLNVVFIYGLLFVLFVGSYISSRFFHNGINKNVLIVLLMGILLIHPIVSMIRTDRKNFKASREIVKNYLNNESGRYVVLTDPLMMLGALYFYEFSPNGNYVYIGYKNAKNIASFKADKYYILSNPKTLQELYTIKPAQSYFLSPPPNWKLVAKRGDVCLLEITDINDVLKDN